MEKAALYAAFFCIILIILRYSVPTNGLNNFYYEYFGALHLIGTVYPK